MTASYITRPNEATSGRLSSMGSPLGLTMTPPGFAPGFPLGKSGILPTWTTAPHDPYWVRTSGLHSVIVALVLTELRDQNGSRRSRTLAPEGPPGFKAGLALREFTIQGDQGSEDCTHDLSFPKRARYFFAIPCYGQTRTRTLAGSPAHLFSRQGPSPG